MQYRAQSVSRVARYLIRICATLSVVLILHLAGTLGASQDSEQPLSFGDSVHREIKGGQVHTFRVSLRENEYARVILQRHGIDLILKLTPTNTSAAMTFQNPAGPQSPITALVFAQTPGQFVIEVRPVKKWLAQGSYDIQVVETKTPEERDGRRLLAQQKVAEGLRLQLLGTAESLRAALVEYEQALELWRGLPDQFEEANTQQSIGRTYVLLRDLPKADDYFQKALAVRGDDKKAWGYTKLDQADAYYSLKKDISESIPLYDEAVRCFKESADRRGEGLAQMQIALAKMRQFQWEKAQIPLNTVLSLSRSEGDSYEEARALNALGGVADNLGKPEEAFLLYTQARDLFHQAGDNVREGNLYNNIGLLHDLWGEQLEAVESYTRAINLIDAALTTGEAEQSFANSRKASLFYNLGSLYVALGSYPEGLNYLEKSLALRQPKDRGPTLMWIGYAQVLKGEPQLALQYCSQALETQEPNDPRRAQTYTVIGMAQQALNDHELALQYFNRALVIQQDPETLDLRGQSITLDKRGITLAATGAVAKARDDFERALNLWRTFKDRNGEAMSLFQLARLERQEGHIDAGLAIAERAIKLIEPLRKNVGAQLRSSYFATKVDYYELYIDLLMLSRKSDNAATINVSALEISEQARARALLDSLALVSMDSLETKDPELKEMVQQRKLYRREVLAKSARRSRLILRNDSKDRSEIDGLDHELENLDREQVKLEKKISSQYPQYAGLTSAEPASAKEIQQQLDSDTLLLEFSLGEKRSYAWTLTTNAIQGYELPPRTQIEDTAMRLLRALNAQNRYEGDETGSQRQARLAKAQKEYSEAVSMLKGMVLDPVARGLDRRRLVIVADGALQLIPFSVFPDPKDASANLISNYEIVTLPSASVLALQRRELAHRKEAPLSLAVVADPVFDVDDDRMVRVLSKTKGLKTKDQPQTTAGHATSSDTKVDLALLNALRDVSLDPNALPRLYKSRDEAAEISTVVSSKESYTAIGFDASRNLVMSGKLDQYRNVHFATHGLMDLEHPELSGIVLSRFDDKGQPQDGYLRLYEIYNLNLPAELVVLSACQTGSGKQIRGEGLMALTRGFMYAGAARVVATLWKVDDAATAELMGLFYKEMFTNGKRPAAALRDAQIGLSKQRRWSSPYYWAGFVLQGEWR